MQRQHPRQRQPAPSRRRGIATVWVIAAVPTVVTLLIVLTDLGQIWEARMELENAAEAAALAAVRDWKATSNTNTARISAQEFAASNTVLGQPVVLEANGGGGGTNDNSLCDGDIVLGNLTPTGIFQAGVAPSSTNYYGARVKKSMQIESLWATFAGFHPGPYTVSVETAARVPFNPGGSPQLLRLTDYVCP